MSARSSVASAALAAGAGFTLALSNYSEIFNTARVGFALIVLLALQLLRRPQLVFTREAAIYATFVGYLLIQLAWTEDRELALNTIVPSIGFLVSLMLFSSLGRMREFEAVLAGALCGFLAGAAAYTLESGFPFKYPDEFSYNAIAGMYLFGIFTALLAMQYSRYELPWLAIAAVLFGLVIATTSIKTNLGLLAGSLAASVFYAAHVARALRRRLLLVCALVLVAGYVVASNEALVGAVDRGADRIALGVEMLQARESRGGYSGFGRRERWTAVGMEGFQRNPVFGEGVEAFRARFGATSHSTLVDLLYNSGLIGFALFYGMIASVLWRLRRSTASTGVRALVLGAMGCYVVISLAGIVHYNAILAAIIALSGAALGLPDRQRDGSRP